MYAFFVCKALIYLSIHPSIHPSIGFPDYASKIVIRAKDDSWGIMGTKEDGKQKYMGSAAAELVATLNVSITR